MVCSLTGIGIVMVCSLTGTGIVVVYCLRLGSLHPVLALVKLVLHARHLAEDAIHGLVVGQRDIRGELDVEEDGQLV